MLEISQFSLILWVHRGPFNVFLLCLKSVEIGTKSEEQGASCKMSKSTGKKKRQTKTLWRIRGNLNYQCCDYHFTYCHCISLDRKLEVDAINMVIRFLKLYEVKDFTQIIDFD